MKSYRICRVEMSSSQIERLLVGLKAVAVPQGKNARGVLLYIIVKWNGR